MPRSARATRTTARGARRPARPKTPAARRTIRFLMPSRRDAVAPAVERILRAAVGAGLSAEQRANLAVASAEALSNAAVHGHRLEPGRQVRVVVIVQRGECATVAVTDSGPGFDVGALNDPTDPGHLLTPGGRGVFLMRRLVDGVDYNQQGNRVRLTVRRQRRGDRA